MLTLQPRGEAAMIPRAPCETLPNNPVAIALAQVRFPALPLFAERQHVAPFAESVLRRYPLWSEDRVVNLLVTDKGVAQQQGEPQYRFSTPDYSWSVVFGADQVALECRGPAYPGIVEFSERFCEVTRALQAHLPVHGQTRLGFRFINEIRIVGGNEYSFWRRVLNRNVLGYDAANEFEGVVQNTISELSVARNDGVFRIRRGFIPGGSTVPPRPGAPSQPLGPFYLIDLDYFNEQYQDFNPNFEPRLRAYNDFIYQVFRWVTDGDGTLIAEFRRPRQ
ncbi:TIGR04255 family protein [bacterium]|nr:MAG: TIGR04255 family protein [bacterium]